MSYGEGYNEERGIGIKEQTDWLSGASGEAQQEANKAIGAWQASLENAKEKYIRTAVDDAMKDTDYQKAKAEGNAAEMGRIIMQAKVQGQNEYNANEGKDEALTSELALAEGIRADAASDDAYWNAGLRKGQQYSRGRAAGMAESAETISWKGDLRADVVIGASAEDGDIWVSNGTGYESMSDAEYKAWVENGGDPSTMHKLGTGHAYGLNRVPYDNYPTLLHEGERVLTAREARQQDSGGDGLTLQITGPVMVREEADVKKVAQEIVRQAIRAKLLAAP